MMKGETVMRDGHQSHVRLGQGSPFSELSAKGASARSQPGILIFSRRQKLLHMNRRALELTGHLNQAEMGLVSEACLAPVRELSAHIQEALDSRREADIWERFELSRVMLVAGRRILARGVGLADRNAYDDSHIVIVLEEMDFRQEHKLNRRDRGPSLLEAVAGFPWNQHDGDPKEEISDARELGVLGRSPCLDRL